MTPERRAWIDSLAAGAAVAVEQAGSRYLGAVLERTRGGRIRVRWPAGEGLFYGTDVWLAGDLVGGRSSRAPARLVPAGLELAAADDIAAIGHGRAMAEQTAARLAQADPETLERIAELSAALRSELDRLGARNTIMTGGGERDQEDR